MERVDIAKVASQKVPDATQVVDFITPTSRQSVLLYAESTYRWLSARLLKQVTAILH